MNKRNTARIRLFIMLAFVAVAAVGYFVKGGIGNSCGIGFDDITLICPLGAILVMISERTAIPLAVMSVMAVLIMCIVLGKIFCSWLCPVHFMTERRMLSRKAKKAAKEARQAARDTGNSGIDTSQVKACGKSSGVKFDSRHAVLAAAVVSTLIFGFPVFCLVCPVGITFALVLLIMRLFVFGETTWTIILMLAVLAIEVVVLPNWCRNLCPLGALHGLFSGLNKTFRPVIDSETCIQEGRGGHCNLCVDACHENINLHDISRGETTLADCSKCRACADACPVSAITFPFLTKDASVEPEKHDA
ncbi:4Fe-4S binding protein [Slackia heliotrinireducens]|uniref:4Fe-4S binding protein n=1 Tax=Slackia heliotrinireducens TaxID=84110 RepID=UPI00331505F0